MIIYRAPVSLLRSGVVSKRSGHVVIVMRHYPRGTGKDLVDEYLRELAPEAALFDEFKAAARASKDHNAAFEAVRYQARFALSAAGDAALARIAERAKARDVHLVCQCGYEERCHCDLLLLTLRHRHGAHISSLPFAYPVYQRRLEETS